MTASLIGEDRTDWLSGEVHDASEYYTRYLLHRGAAVLVDGDLPAAPALTTQAIQNADPVAIHRDPVSKRGPKA